MNSIHLTSTTGRGYKTISKFGENYRKQDKAHPIKELNNSNKDNITIARKKIKTPNMGVFMRHFLQHIILYMCCKIP